MFFLCIQLLSYFSSLAGLSFIVYLKYKFLITLCWVFCNLLITSVFESVRFSYARMYNLAL